MAKKFFTIRQAARFLKVTNSIIKEMITAGTFRTVKKGSTTKIPRKDIDEWLANLSEQETQELAMHKAMNRFGDYFNSRYIHLDFKAENKFEAIAAMSKKAKSLKLVSDHRWLYKVVIAREELVSTAVGKGVALLHPRHPHPKKVKKPSIIFGRSIKKIEFDALDKKPVDLYFLLLLHNDAQHLFSISYITKFMMKDENLKKLRDESSKRKIAKMLTKKSFQKP